MKHLVIRSKLLLPMLSERKPTFYLINTCDFGPQGPREDFPQPALLLHPAKLHFQKSTLEEHRYATR